MRIRMIRVTLFLAGLILLLCAGPYGPRFDTTAFAHHEFNAEYDASEVTRWVGTLPKSSGCILARVSILTSRMRAALSPTGILKWAARYNFAARAGRAIRSRSEIESRLPATPRRTAAKMASAKEVTLADGGTVFGRRSSEGAHTDNK
jgi:hypothetical protein